MLDLAKALRNGTLQECGAEELFVIVEQASAEIDRLKAEIDRLRASYRWAALQEIERLQEALERIEQWSRAYPLSVFPEPDLPKAAEVLKASGMSQALIDFICERMPPIEVAAGTIRALTADNERLTAEVERLRADVTWWENQYGLIVKRLRSLAGGQVEDGSG